MKATGRWGESMKLGRREAEAHPADALVRAFDAFSWTKFDQIPPPGRSTAPIERCLLSEWRDEACRYLDKARNDALVDGWLNDEPFSPSTWNVWGKRMTNSTEPDKGHFGHMAGAVEGSAFTFVEVARQLEAAGKTADAARVAADARANFGLAPASASGPAAAIADRLEEDFDTLFRAHLNDLVSSAFEGKECAFLLKVLESGEKALQDAARLLGPDNGVRRPASPLGLAPAQWLALARRPAADSAGEVFLDRAARVGVSEEGLNLGRSIESVFPDDPAVLEARLQFFRQVRFDNQAVSNYNDRIRAAQFGNQDVAYRAVEWKRGTVKERTKACEDFAAAYPFDTGILTDIAYRIEQMEDYPLAVKYYELCASRNPLDYRSKLNALHCAAIARDEMLTEAQVASFDAEAPAGLATRVQMMSDAYQYAGNTTRSLELLEKCIDATKTRLSQPYFAAASMARFIGQPDRAIARLTGFTKVVPGAVATCMAFNEISLIELSRGNLPAARKACDEGIALYPEAETVLTHDAYLTWHEGRRADSIKTYRQMAKLFPGNNNQAELGWALLANGDEAGAMAAAEEGIKTALTQAGCFSLKSTIQRRHGDDLEALKTLDVYNSRMIHDPKPPEELAWHYFFLGNAKDALWWARESLKRAREGERETAMGLVARMCINAGLLDEAETLAKRIRARYPLNTSANNILARVALARKNPDAALAQLIPMLNRGDGLGLNLAAQAHLAKGDAKQAVEMAQKSVGLLIAPNASYYMTLGDAQAAAGNTDEAKKAWRVAAETQGPHSIYTAALKGKI